MCSPRWHLGLELAAVMAEDVLPAAVGVLLLVAVVAELGVDVLPVAVVGLLLAAVIVLRRSLAGTILFISGCGGRGMGILIASSNVRSLLIRHRLSTTTSVLLFVLMRFPRCRVQSGCVYVGQVHGSSCCRKLFCELDSRLLRSHLYVAGGVLVSHRCTRATSSTHLLVF